MNTLICIVEISDVTLAMDELIQKFPIARHALTPIVLRSQLYNALDNNKNLVDSEIVINKCCNK